MKYYAERYQTLTPSQTLELERNGCRCGDWSRILVSDDFDPNRCHDVHFSGDVWLSRFDAEVQLPEGICKPSGLYHVHLHNCSIGPNVLIERVHEYISGYNIDADAVITNVDRIFVGGKTSFGNGLGVEVLNETGGREVWISHNLSAQVAYLMAFYRHDARLIEALQQLSHREALSHTSDIGEIGAHAFVRCVCSIENVNIGAYAHIEGASHLQEGTIVSNQEAPVHIGYNVSCVNFILLSGSQILDGATISNCLLGQGSRLSHLFSAHDSLFFANCQGENGEACAVFAGPYTVSMHKSSLLIAGYYSFLNAGSGSNQSNHLYKLGPIHQGIVERGSKTTSDSYILWPSHIGPFTLVMGRHVDHVDSSDFPFSYLIEDHNETFLVPGVNLRSVGTIRDAKKWPDRDRRTDSQRLDNINFNLLSPYTVGKMLKAHRTLSELSQILGNTDDHKISYRNMRIRQRALERGVRLYGIAIVKFLGNSVIHRLRNCPCLDDRQVRDHLRPDSERGLGRWIDLCGMLVPREELELTIEAVKSGQIASLDELNTRLSALHQEYYNLEWPWAYRAMLQWFDLEADRITCEDIRRIVDEWERSVVELDQMLYEDAKKEFAMSIKVGFGLATGGNTREADFECVRGDFQTNPFVLSVLDHIQAKQTLANDIRQRLSR
ncbi:MAG: DUF4954 family protein [Porphyromonadaceae bacterium]|nr:DUF4954 family protein [Porphyromonadaceae bacterium]